MIAEGRGQDTASLFRNRTDILMKRLVSDDGGETLDKRPAMRDPNRLRFLGRD